MISSSSYCVTHLTLIRLNFIVACVVLYDFEFAVVVRTAMMPFACTTNNGVSTMIAEPTVRCSATDPSYVIMSKLGAAVMVVYGGGLPLTFAYFLWRHRVAINADQLLRGRGEGETSMTNPNISIRRRYRKLYEDYKPKYKYWRLVLIARKLCLAAIGILLSSNASLQVRTSWGQRRVQ